jgi:RNA polymerase sigma factor (sigma-70 family)
MITADAYELNHAAYRARLLAAGGAGYRPHDWEDLRQELLMDCARRSTKFDPSRGSWQGFVSGVMRNQATVLAVRGQRRAVEVLVDDLPKPEDMDAETALDALDHRPRVNLETAVVLKVDVERILEELPIQLRTLARLLDRMSVPEASRQIGKSRSRVYQMMRQIKAAFITAGYRSDCRRRSRRRI